MDDEQREALERMMTSAAGTLLMLANDRNQDVEDGLTWATEQMPWDEYRALRALRSEVAKARDEKQREQH